MSHKSASFAAVSTIGIDLGKNSFPSTDVIVTDEVVYAFGAEFETGVRNDAFIRFGGSANNPEIKLFVLEGFFGEINPHHRLA